MRDIARLKKRQRKCWSIGRHFLLYYLSQKREDSFEQMPSVVTLLFKNSNNFLESPQTDWSSLLGCNCSTRKIFCRSRSRQPLEGVIEREYIHPHIMCLFYTEKQTTVLTTSLNLKKNLGFFLSIQRWNTFNHCFGRLESREDDHFESEQEGSLEELTWCLETTANETWEVFLKSKKCREPWSGFCGCCSKFGKQYPLFCTIDCTLQVFLKKLCWSTSSDVAVVVVIVSRMLTQDEPHTLHSIKVCSSL